MCNDQYLSSFVGHRLKCILKKPCMGIICLYDKIQFFGDITKYSSGGSTHESMWTVTVS